MTGKATVPPFPPDPGPFDYLIRSIESAIPKTFSLSDDVRGYFKDGKRRRLCAIRTLLTELVIHDSCCWKARLVCKQWRVETWSGEVRILVWLYIRLRLTEEPVSLRSRHGFLEDRDPTRVKDRNNNLIVCFKCQRTALPRPHTLDEAVIPSAPPSDPTTPTISSGWQRPERRAKLAADLALQATRIISCDYCTLHWHLDCLDPPMVQMPSPLKRWMCPNHVEHDMVCNLSAGCFPYS